MYLHLLTYFGTKSQLAYYGIAIASWYLLLVNQAQAQAQTPNLDLPVDAQTAQLTTPIPASIEVPLITSCSIRNQLTSFNRYGGIFIGCNGGHNR